MDEATTLALTKKDRALDAAAGALAGLRDLVVSKFDVSSDREALETIQRNIDTVYGAPDRDADGLPTYWDKLSGTRRR
jgi:hypothetical protein